MQCAEQITRILFIGLQKRKSIYKSNTFRENVHQGKHSLSRDCKCDECVKFFRRRDRVKFTLDVCKQLGNRPNDRRARIPFNEQIVLLKFFTENETKHLLAQRKASEPCDCRICDTFADKITEMETSKVEEIEKLMKSPPKSPEEDFARKLPK